jgi:hypothetical protein
MATRKVDSGGGDKQGSIEIAYVKLAGNDTTLQKVVDAFTTLISRPVSSGTALPTTKRVNALPASNLKATPNGNGQEAALVEDESIDVQPDAVEANEPVTPAAPKPQRKYALPTGIPIDTESGMSVDNYVKQYKLESNEEKYLALAGWLKTYRQVPLKAGLIVTLCKHLDWTLPADVTMPLRKMVNKKLQWLERVGTGDYQIHQIGESKLAKLKN